MSKAFFHSVQSRYFASFGHGRFPPAQWEVKNAWEVPPRLAPSPLLGGAGDRGPTIVPGRGPGGKGPPRCLWIALENASPLPFSWRAPALPSQVEPSAAVSAGPPRSAPRPPDSTPCLPGHTHRHRPVSRTQARIREDLPLQPQLSLRPHRAHSKLGTGREDPSPVYFRLPGPGRGPSPDLLLPRACAQRFPGHARVPAVALSRQLPG